MATLFRGLESIIVLGMASSTIEERLEKIKNLRIFLNSVEDKVKTITNELHWSYNKLLETDSSTVVCSVNPEHRVGISRVKEHEERCQWLKDGYRVDDLPFPEYHGQGSCVVFTPELQDDVIRNKLSEARASQGIAACRGIPQTSARFDQDFTRDEKLALYDYVISNTKGHKMYKEFISLPAKDDKTDKKVMTPLEIAAAERDAKRRRATYRNKVHTNRKTQTEILREVIESQMEALREEISDKNYIHPVKNLESAEPKAMQHRQTVEEDSRWEYEESHRFDKSHKKSHKKHRKSHSNREYKHKHDRNYKESKHKSKKRKRSHSCSESPDRTKHKKSKKSKHASHSHKNSDGH